MQKARGYLDRAGVDGEVVISDNGSTDGSQEAARQAGARVVHAPIKGYGGALIAGISAARGRYVIMGDADDSYDFTALDPFLHRLRDGDALVMGNRFRGGIAPGAMPALHRYLGNPVLSTIGRVLFGGPVKDFHCGLRGFSRKHILDLHLQSTGMEFASEMVVKAILADLPVSEVPTTLSPDGRSRPPHLRSWRDGWRHLRFLMLYSPLWLFLIPGLVLMGLGILGTIATSTSPFTLGHINLDVNTLVGSTAAIIVGFQAVLFAVFTKVYAVTEQWLPTGRKIKRLMQVFSLERGLAAGGIILTAGIVGLAFAFARWHANSFGDLDARGELRLVAPSAAALVMGAQTILASLFISILCIRHRPTGEEPPVLS
ncbi:MAG TPA: glycosyltransferase family 2 protein [Mycobacteriales bacterium]|nr:glycosyltransferase family 2 protein [Mycobacteriales bacterium]